VSARDQPKPLDLQAVRLAAVTATGITERRGELTGDDWAVLEEATFHLYALLGEVERLNQEVTTREAAARHALDAAQQARDQVGQLRAELEAAQDGRAAAYLYAVQCWDVLDRAAAYLPDNVLTDPEQPADHDLRQVRHDAAVQIKADPPAAARALWEELQAARRVVTDARCVGRDDLDETDVAERLADSVANYDKVKAGAPR
jgi:hypothetical protein